MTEIERKHNRTFYFLLGNTMVSTFTNMTVWFAITFYAYLQTQAVTTTAILSGLYLVAVSTTGIYFGSLVDNYKKKHMMLLSGIISFVAYALCFVLYISTPQDTFKNVAEPAIWALILLVLVGVVAGNIRGIALPTVVTILIPEERRDKANGLVGTVSGVALLAVSVVSGFLVGQSGMYLVLIIALIAMALTLAHLWFIQIPEHEVVHAAGESEEKKIDLKGTIKAVRLVPGLLWLILFTTFNNFLGGVYMSLLDAYGLELVSVEVWGILWGLLSTAFIIGGLIIAKVGLGKNPLRSLFMANITIWTISCFFTIQPSIVLLTVGMYIYLTVMPFIEASEHTIVQKVVPVERQGRVFGFAQSVEMAASPLTAFIIGPIAQFVFIPFMSDGGEGARLIGSWFGTGPARGIALVFTITGVIGLTVTLLAMRTPFYKQLSVRYQKAD